MARTSNGKSSPEITFIPAGLSKQEASELARILQARLVALLDLGLTVKHVHWNVVGPHFIGVHEMLDPQAEAIAAMVDALAERITTLGGSPTGLAGAIVAQRGWDDYSLGRDLVDAHLGALDLVYGGVVTSHRKAIAETEELDPVTQDTLIEQTATLELFHWFVRAHLEDAGGKLASAGAETERAAAASARRGAPPRKPAKRR